MRVILAGLALALISGSWALANPGDHRPHPYVVDPDTIDVGLSENLRIIDVGGPEKAGGLSVKRNESWRFSARPMQKNGSATLKLSHHDS